MTPQAIIGLVLKVSIVLTVFGFGLQSSRDDLLYLLRRPRVLSRSLVAMFVVMPLFVLLMTSAVSFNRAVLVALVALSISPVPPLLPRKVTKSAGLASYGLGLMVTAASLSIAVIPLATYLLGKYFHRAFAMGPGAVAKLIVPSVLIPIAAGVLFQRLAPSIAKRIGHPLARTAGIMLLLGVICILAFAAPTVWSLVGNGTIVAFIAFIVVGLGAGHLLGGRDPNEQVTLALSTACRHPALAVAIAGANIPEEHHVFAAVLLYVLLNVMLTIPYVAWQRKRVQTLQGSHTRLPQ
jgi:bile acid:Na+ symporter, BASS family